MKIRPCVKFSAMLVMWALVFSVKWIAVVGVCVLLHEIAHMVACRILGIPVFGILPLPWGLTAFAPVMYEPYCQFLVSVAGPAFNFFLLAFSGIVKRIFGSEVAELFVLANLANGILNLVPALPLDGGIILKSVLCSGFGLVRGFVYVIRITAAIGVLLMLLGIQVFWVTGCNVSYFVAGLFIIYNIRHEKELVICIKKRILTGEIRSLGVYRKIYVSHDSNALCLVNLISPSYTAIFTVMKENEEIGTLHQGQLLEYVMKNTMITAGECIEKM